VKTAACFEGSVWEFIESLFQLQKKHAAVVKLLARTLRSVDTGEKIVMEVNKLMGFTKEKIDKETQRAEPSAQRCYDLLCRADEHCKRHEATCVDLKGHEKRERCGIIGRRTRSGPALAEGPHPGDSSGGSGESSASYYTLFPLAA